MSLLARIARGPAPAAEPVDENLDTRAPKSPASPAELPARVPAWVARTVQRGGPIRATKELTR